jgi:hypothetical protein
MIFVFGSNTHGIHGAGAARDARVNFGAKQGQGFGIQGQSFAIPTRTVEQGNPYIVDMPFIEIQDYVAMFITFAQRHPELEFKVTQIGTGHAGYEHTQMVALFLDSPPNCYFDEAWKSYFIQFGVRKQYWGTFDLKKGSN